MSERIKVGVLGATGMVGQHFVKFLSGHPWFALAWGGGRGGAGGKRSRDATTWRLRGVMPPEVRDLIVKECKPEAGAPQLMFSATDASVATEIEQAFANAGHTIVSNSRNHRMDADVPLLVPEVNADHLNLLRSQKSARKWA